MREIGHGLFQFENGQAAEMPCASQQMFGVSASGAFDKPEIDLVAAVFIHNSSAHDCWCGMQYSRLSEEVRKEAKRAPGVSVTRSTVNEMLNSGWLCIIGPKTFWRRLSLVMDIREILCPTPKLIRKILEEHKKRK